MFPTTGIEQDEIVLKIGAIDGQLLDKVSADAVKPFLLSLRELAAGRNLGEARSTRSAAVSSGSSSLAACLTIEMMSTRFL